MNSYKQYTRLLKMLFSRNSGVSDLVKYICTYTEK